VNTAQFDHLLPLFELHLRAEAKSPKTVLIYRTAVRQFITWMAATHAEVSTWPEITRDHLREWPPSPSDGPLPATKTAKAIDRYLRLGSAHQCTDLPHVWLSTDQGGAEGDLMELAGWTSRQMLTRYCASARSARARCSYDRIELGDRF
jgi:integrase family protein with SAM-like domain